MSEINTNMNDLRVQNAQRKLSMLEYKKRQCIEKMKKLDVLNRMLSDFIEQGQGTNLTFGEWLQLKKIPDSETSSMDGLKHLRTYDEETVDHILDIGDAFDDIEEQYDNYDEQGDRIKHFLGIETYSNAKGSSRAQRKENRKKRREARKQFREEKKELRRKKRHGEISAAEFHRLKNQKKKQKKETIREYGGTFFERAWGSIKKFNPISGAVRGGALAAIHTNVFGYATRLAPAIVNDPKFSANSVNKAKAQWQKFKNAWSKAGGNVEKLEKAVREGYKKKPLLAKHISSGADGYSSIDAYSYNLVHPEQIPAEGMMLYGADGEQYSNIEAATATLVAAGIGFVTTLLSKFNFDKNPYKKGQEPADFDEGVTMQEPAPQTKGMQYDPQDDAWVDPQTGERVDPNTGALIADIPKYAIYATVGVGLLIVAGAIIYFTKKKK